ncbi:uncharacterized protein LOC126559948 [Anopheles maculipalpis]|uniref:uncharacterized protein LOC126559948 n=1 Tax=Anopheles maculipalpis TaxID=1496333 RepID=UPI00215927B1|nr:uncharacterized protein LOC126559948 [Anopheles maculipalpis]
MSSLSSDCESSYYTESEAESDYVTHEEGQSVQYNHTLEVEDIIRKHVDITTKNAIGLNHQYKAKLLVLRQQLEGLLSRCQHRLHEVDKSLDDIRLNLTPRSRPTRPRHPGYICGQPFFKDHELYPGPHNEDYLYRKNVKKEFFPLDLFESIETFWTRKDKQMLRESIASQAYEFVRRENQLRDKMCIRSENARRIIKERIELKSLPLAEIWHRALAYDGKFGGQKFTVDWLKISAAIMAGRHSAFTCESMWNNFLMPGLKRCLWTSDEESKLVAAVEAHKRCNWKLIALSVENRSEYQCFVHYQTNFSEISQIKRNPWTPEEDELLLRLVNENRIGSNIIWNKIVERIPFRNKVQVYQRYKYTLLRPLRGAKFTAEEDCVITAYVQQYGDDFRYFPDDLLPGRTTKQIRARYMNTLRFVNTHVGWSLEEDKRLMSYIAEHLTEEGAQKISWADCSKYLGNHSRLSCRTRYYTIEKFLERHPNATLENVPRREKKRLSSNVTDKNWIKTIVEIKSTPRMAQKPSGEPFEFGRSSGIECGLHEQMKFSFRYKFGYKMDVDAKHNHVFMGAKIMLYLLEGFQELSSVQELSIAPGGVPNHEALFKAIRQCPLDWPNLVSMMRPKMTLSGDAMLFCRIPPSYNTVLGLRGVCLNACSEHLKQTLPEQKAKKVRQSFDSATYDQALGVFVERFRKIFHWTMLLMMLNIDDITLDSGEQSCHERNDNPITDSGKCSQNTNTDLQLKSMENLIIPVGTDKLSNLSYCTSLPKGTSLPIVNDNRNNIVASITIIDPKDLPAVPDYNCTANVPRQETEFKCQQYLSKPLVTSAAGVAAPETGSNLLQSNSTPIESILPIIPANNVKQSEAEQPNPSMDPSPGSTLLGTDTSMLPNTIPFTIIQVPEEISFVQQRLVNAVANITSPEEALPSVKRYTQQVFDSTSNFLEEQADVKMRAIDEPQCPKQLNESGKILCTFSEIVTQTNEAPFKLSEVTLAHEMQKIKHVLCKEDVTCSPVTTTNKDTVMVDSNYQPTEDSIRNTDSDEGNEKQNQRYLAAIPPIDSTLVPCDRNTFEGGLLAHNTVEDNEKHKTEVPSTDDKAFVEAHRMDCEIASEVQSNDRSPNLLIDVDEPLTAVDIIRMLRSRRNAHQYEDDSDNEQEFSHLPND